MKNVSSFSLSNILGIYDEIDIFSLFEFDAIIAEIWWNKNSFRCFRTKIKLFVNVSNKYSANELRKTVKIDMACSDVNKLSDNLA